MDGSYDASSRPRQLYVPEPAVPPAAAASGEIELDIDTLRGFCSGGMQQMVDELDSVWRDFGSVPIHAGLFGFSDVGEVVTEQHGAAQQVFSAALKGTRDDVARLQDSLRAQLRDYQDADDAAAEALSKLTGDSPGTPSFAETEFRRAVAAHAAPAPSVAASAPAAQPDPAPTNAGGAIE